MSGTDDRVVSMHFENANFQKNVGDTLGSLDKLKQSLNFEGAANAFADIEGAAGKVNLGNIGSAVEGVSSKFIALTTVAVTALANITNKAINAGETFLKSFTVSPIMDGFHEMETKVGSIQTILANTARFNTGLPEVTASLDQLNKYADKTIYNFGDMTKNIGLFTNAGIKIGDATSMIQGFSNVAAASGTTAEGAAGAAYQLSQALSTGQIRLMDWKSLTNVGMGNKNMQDGLIKIAGAMGQFNKTGDDAKEVQANFNASLESGWLSADVMTAYLKIMAGQMSDADMKAMHLSKSVVSSFAKEQKTAEEAATKVRTFTQLVGTIKESVGSGWTDTWETLVGNFTEATDLFTNINNVVGGFVGKMSDARNNLLNGWKADSGRTWLINGLKQAFQDVAAVIRPIHDAFREIFPATTAKQLVHLSWALQNLAIHLKPTPEAVDRIKRTFAGLFAVVDIVKTVITDVIRVIFHLVSKILPDTGSGILGVTANAGDFLVALDKMLVKGGKIGELFDYLGHLIDLAATGFDKGREAVVKFFTAIAKSDAIKDIGNFFVEVGKDIQGFFDALTRVNVLDHVKTLFNDVKNAISGLFDTIGHSTAATATVTETGNALGRVGDRAKAFADEGRKILDFFEKLETGAVGLAQKVLPVIGNFFGNLGSAIASGFQSGSFDQVFDVLNVGLLGGIVLLLRKFFKQGLNLDLGGGLFKQIKETLGDVTTTLKTMQAELKAKALMEIAIAMGVLTVSIIALSLIDSKNLAKSLAAMAVGFAELVAVMKMLDNIGGGATGPGKLTLLVGSLIGLTGAAVVMAGAISLLSTLNGEDLARGLAGIAGGLAILVGAMKLMNDQGKATIGGGLAIIAMTRALVGLATAVKAFGEMSWGDMTKGLAGVGIALGMVVLAMNALPGGALAGVGLAAAGFGMILIATALGILVGVVKLFSLMSVGDLAKGLIAMTVALGAMGLAMQLFPPWMPLIAIGMMLLVPALAALIGVIAIIGHMKIGTLVQGIVAMAAVLLVLAVGMAAMESAIPGALATFVVAAAMEALTMVIKTLGAMSIGDIAKGIGAIAAVLLVLGLAAVVMTPILPALFALGISLALIASAFALFGLGALEIAKAFEIMSKAGNSGIKVIIDAISQFLKAIPTFVGLLLEALLSSVTQFLKIGDVILGLVGKFLGDLLGLVIANAPKIALAILSIITSALSLIRGIIGQVVETGFIVIMAFMKGVSDHIIELTNLALEILVKFLDTFVKNEQKIIDAGVNMLLTFLGAIANRAADITAAGLNLLLSFLAGMINNLYRVIDFAVTILITLAQTLANETQRIINAGADILAGFIRGLGRDIQHVINAGIDVVVQFIAGLGQNVQRIVDAGAGLILHIIEGITRDIHFVADKGAQLVIDFINQMADTIRLRGPALEGAFLNLAGAIIDGLSGGLMSKAKDLPGAAGKIFGALVDKGKEVFDSHSPSRVFFKMGLDNMLGLAMGIRKDKTAESNVVTQAERIVTAFQATISRIPDSLEGMDEFSPTITPVLDLTKVQAAASGLNRLMADQTITPSVSYGQAAIISEATRAAQNTSTSDTVDSGPREIKFEQNIYSPKALSTNDVYKGTKNVLATAKEELNI